MTANFSKSCLTYLTKLIDQYSNTYSIGKKPINADYSVQTEQIETKVLSLKLMIESELLSIRIFLAKVALKIGADKYLLSILF